MCFVVPLDFCGWVGVLLCFVLLWVFCEFVGLVVFCCFGLVFFGGAPSRHAELFSITEVGTADTSICFMML